MLGNGRDECVEALKQSACGWRLTHLVCQLSQYNRWQASLQHAAVLPGPNLG